MDDPQIAELKELIRQNIAVATETNRIVHGMRNGARLKSFFWLAVIAVSLGSSVYSYFYFIQPRLNEIKNFYQTTVVPLQGAGSSINDLLKSLKSAPTGQ